MRLPDTLGSQNAEKYAYTYHMPSYTGNQRVNHWENQTSEEEDLWILLE